MTFLEKQIADANILIQMKGIEIIRLNKLLSSATEGKPEASKPREE
jgi:hypothetical protein